MEPSCLLGLGTSYLLFELHTEGLEIGFEEPDVPPITRRWGICFRSTQRYTVCGLTPKYVAASRTVRGSSSAAGNLIEASDPFRLIGSGPQPKRPSQTAGVRTMRP